MLRYAPWNGAPAFADWATAEARILVRDVQGLHLRYQHPLSGAWQPNWSPAADLPPGINLFLPSAIELAVDGPTPAWPPVVVVKHGLCRTRIAGSQLKSARPCGKKVCCLSD